jgi:predicted phosphodiesterase
MKKDNVLIIGDSHLPFCHRNYLEFCKEIQARCKCGTVVHIGDLVDNHAISYHEHDPDGWSPADEMAETDKHLKKWFKAFPVLHLCRGNHDVLVDRRRKTVGLPRRCFAEFRDIWGLPKGWIDKFEFTIDGVLYKHGTGMSGRYAHVQAAERARQSTVIGHTHSSCGVEYLVSSKDCIFGMNVGSGVDREAYAFAYGKDFPRKPVLACGIVTDKGRYCQVFPMKL